MERATQDQGNADFKSLYGEQRFDIGIPDVLEMATRTDGVQISNRF